MKPPGAVRAGATSIVLDVGTGAVKAAVLDPAGRIAAQATAALETRTGSGGVMEQDAEAWFLGAGEAVRALVDSGATAGASRLILTGQMQDLTLADEQGRPLRPTLLYGDVRARDEAEEVRERLGDERLRAWTGNDQDAGGLLAKLRWLRRHEPSRLHAARHVFLGAADALAFRLTGVAKCDTTTASTTGTMRLDTRGPLPDEAFHALGLAGVRERLPRFVPGGSRVGELGAAAAGWGLPPGLPVHLGPGDAGATTVGAGAGEPGPVSGYVGTSGWVAFSARGRGDPDKGVFTLAHPAAGATIQIAPLLTAGGNLAWASRAVGDGAGYGELVERALDRPPGRLLYLPYLQGERSPFRDPYVRGAFLGLDPATTRDDLLRAVLEGVALAYRHALEALLPASDATELVLTGGGTRSAGWCRLFATVTRRPVRVQDAPEAVGLRGALRSVQVAAGERDDYRLPVEGEVVEPDPRLAERYDALYAVFRDAHGGLGDLSRRLARAVAGGSAAEGG